MSRRHRSREVNPFTAEELAQHALAHLAALEANAYRVGRSDRASGAPYAADRYCLPALQAQYRSGYEVAT